MQTNVRIADLYYRISNEDFKKEGRITNESESIQNQKIVLRKYCEDNNIIVAKEFVDDGFSGSDFDRPGFQSMLEHLASGKANTVITKDLSRLGRTMAESSQYAEKYFPEHKIQYISINENFDSNVLNTMIPFTFAMNDVYLRQTSEKVRQVAYSKMSKGEYCVCPPYGYMKDPRNKAHLIPDPMAAAVVQRIFDLASQGMSAHKIADILTAEGVLSPLKYRSMKSSGFTDAGVARASDVWSHVTVKRMLKNRTYLGHSILGTTKRPAIKSKVKIAVPENSWYVTENTHEPLVTEDTYNRAQLYIGMNTKKWKDNPNFRLSIFNGLVFCESCGAAMCSAGSVYKGERNKYWYLACNNISRNDLKKCTHGARIKYCDLMQLVLNDLNAMIHLSKDERKDIIDKAVKKSELSSVYDGVESQIHEIKKRLVQIDKSIQRAYDDYGAEAITGEALTVILNRYSKERANLEDTLLTIQQGKSECTRTELAFKKFFDLTNQFTNLTELTPEIVRTFIKRIEIGEKILPEGYQVASHEIPYTMKVTIHYRFIDDFIGKQNYKWNPGADIVREAI